MANNNPIPPKLPQLVLSRVIRDDLAEEVLGDLEEKFLSTLETKSLFKAKLNYWYQVLNYLRPFALKKSRSKHSNYIPMFKHTLLLAFRNFKKFRSSFLINLIGLSSGLTCTLLIYMWVSDERSVDKYYENDDRLYQVMENRVQSHGIWTAESNSGPLEAGWKAEMPEVEYISVATRTYEGELTVNSVDIKDEFKFVGEDFFKVFSYKILQGNRDEILKDKNSIAISEDLAWRLFHTLDDVVGKTITFNHDRELFVTGVFENLPKYSSQQFHYLVSVEGIKNPDYNWHWNTTWIQTYLLIQPGTNIQAFNEKVADYVKVKTEGKTTHRTPFITKYSDRYLYGNYENGVQSGGRIEYVRLFSIIAGFTLLIACINFINLSTARASRRTKEVGIKKTLGANRGIIVFQYLGEAALLTTISLLFALVMATLLLPEFNAITGKQLTIGLDKNLGIGILAIWFGTAIISGSYPAFYLSNFSPVAVLKGQLKASVGELWMRRGLVVFQFVLATVMISSVWVIYKQIEMAQSKNLGYEKEQVLMFSRNGKLENPTTSESFLAAVRNTPGVVNASSTGHSMIGHSSGTSGLRWEGRDPNDFTEFEHFTVNFGLIETLGIEIVEGRSFSRSFGADSSKVIVSEEAVRYMNMKNPVGKKLKLWGQDVQIIGVSKDLQYESIRDQIKPLFFRLDPGDSDIFLVKVQAGQESKALESLATLHDEFNPEFSFNHWFLDQSYQELYKSEQKVSTLSRYFAGLTILISCLGLFGLAAFTAEVRTKEIGVRKILGSSTMNIVRMLSMDFSKMVLFAIVIALPIAYWISFNWLEAYAYKIELKWWYFAGAGMIALLISLLMVGSQTFKAAQANPVDSLRSE